MHLRMSLEFMRTYPIATPVRATSLKYVPPFGLLRASQTNGLCVKRRKIFWIFIEGGWPKEATVTNVDLQALRRGDESAFRRLVKENHSTLLRMARIYSPSPEVAEETVQETWVAVLRGLDGFHERATLRTWICRILVNIARRRAGLESRQVPFSALRNDENAPAVAPDQFHREGPHTGHWATRSGDWSRLPEERLLSQELRDVVSRAISQLPPAQRIVITLRDVEGWTAPEVSEVLDVQDSYQRVLLHRARIVVRTALERYLKPQTEPPGHPAE